MGRAAFKIGFVLLVSLFLINLAGCGKPTDDDRLPPEKRAERFDKFIDEGMHWKEVVKAFKPSKYQIVVPHSGDEDLFSRFGGGKKVFDETEFAKELAAAPNFDTFYFEFIWSTRPLVFHDVSFGKDGKVRNFSRNGSFN